MKKKLKRKIQKVVKSFKRFAESASEKASDCKKQASKVCKTIVKKIKSIDIRPVLKSVSSTLRFCILLAVIVFSSMIGNRLHRAYLELKVSPSVVSIHNPKNTQSGGTGFHVKARSGRTVLMTNAHICRMRDANNEVLVLDKLHSGRFISRKVLEVYPDNDLCIMEALPDYPALTLGDSPEVSQSAIAIGYPLLEALNISEGRIKDFGPIEMPIDVEREECVGPRRHVESQELMFGLSIQYCVESYQATHTDLIIYPGNSGSPLVNIYGNVIGVIFAGNTLTHWGSAVVYSDVVKALGAF